MKVLTAFAMVVLLVSVATLQVQAKQSGQITQAEAENAAQSVANFCKILIGRMEELIEDSWATQDLQDLAAVWDSLACHQVFGVDERIRWMLR